MLVSFFRNVTFVHFLEDEQQDTLEKSMAKYYSRQSAITACIKNTKVVRMLRSV